MNKLIISGAVAVVSVTANKDWPMCYGTLQREERDKVTGEVELKECNVPTTRA